MKQTVQTIIHESSKQAKQIATSLLALLALDGARNPSGSLDYAKCARMSAAKLLYNLEVLESHYRWQTKRAEKGGEA